MTQEEYYRESMKAFVGDRDKLVLLREVREIPWDKVFETLMIEDGVWVDKNTEKKIQELVERALKGEL